MATFQSAVAGLALATVVALALMYSQRRQLMSTVAPCSPAAGIDGAGLGAAPAPRYRFAEPRAINHLDGRAYPHHPVMAAVGLGPFPFDRLYLTEWNGLRVPAGFDCDIFYQETEEGWTEEARRVHSHDIDIECIHLSSHYYLLTTNTAHTASPAIPMHALVWDLLLC